MEGSEFSICEGVLWGPDKCVVWGKETRNMKSWVLGELKKMECFLESLLDMAMAEETLAV